MKITTNNQPRTPLYGYELPPEQRKEFDYLTDEEYETRDFIKYKGNYYDLGEFMCAPESMKPWDGYSAGSYFSGVVIRYDLEDRVIIGTYTV